MSAIQMPNVAGAFYPADPETLSTEVDRFLTDAHAYQGPAPKAIIAPHAGYIYSGPVAGNAYASLRPVADIIQRVVVLAPSHRVAFRGIATSEANEFRTPLGDIPVDTEAVELATRLPQVGYLEQAFQGEHALEVQLPFLQRTLNNFRLVPFIVGDTQAEEVAQLLDLLWGGRRDPDRDQLGSQPLPRLCRCHAARPAHHGTHRGAGHQPGLRRCLWT